MRERKRGVAREKKSATVKPENPTWTRTIRRAKGGLYSFGVEAKRSGSDPSSQEALLRMTVTFVWEKTQRSRIDFPGALGMTSLAYVEGGWKD